MCSFFFHLSFGHIIVSEGANETAKVKNDRAYLKV